MKSLLHIASCYRGIRNSGRVIALCSTLLTGVACAQTNEWTPLLDERLSHWELWMGVPHETVTGLPPGTPTSPDGRNGTPLGLGNDPKRVFTVIKEDGRPVLKITGEIYGGLTTLKDYTNYHFQCQVKFGPKRWEPRLNVARDSGLLYHCTGPHGTFWNVWMRSIEFQVIEEGMADLYLLGGAIGDTRTLPPEKSGAPKPYQGTWDPSQPLKMVGPVQRAGNFESPLGEWTTLDLCVVGDKSVHAVNGHVVLAVENMRLRDGTPLHSGKIQIQSEGAEVYYRDIRIRPIKAFEPPFVPTKKEP